MLRRFNYVFTTYNKKSNYILNSYTMVSCRTYYNIPGYNMSKFYISNNRFKNLDIDKYDALGILLHFLFTNYFFYLVIFCKKN
jgi:hypothetical protein